MTRRKAWAHLSGRIWWGVLAGVTTLVIGSPAHAEDLKGRWYFGGHLGYLSTSDDIRSNADIIIGPLGDDNIPFTGDPNEAQACAGAGSQSTFCDPRPDDLLSRETAIEETFRYEIEAGFGLTSWLNLQLDASYFKGDVGPIDVYLKDHFPIAGNPVQPGVLDRFDDRERVTPVQAGELTEIPVTISAIARFRKDSPLNPYIGVGFGMIFTSMDRSQDVDDLNARMSSMRIRGVANEFDESLTPARFANLSTDGRIPFRNPVRTDVSDSFTWHLTAGAEYFFNDRMSMVFDARYLFADEYLELDLTGEDQIDLLIYSEELFRPDGSVAIFKFNGDAPNPLCSENDYQGMGCDPVNRPAGQRVSPEPTTSCPRSADFDRDGQIDRCYDQNVGASPEGFRDPRGDFIVQGGRINLSGFAVAIGMRFHF